MFLKKFFPYMLISFFVVLSGAQAASSRSPFMDDLDYLYGMGKQSYCYWDLKAQSDAVNWDQLYMRARIKMQQAQSIEDYARVMTEMVAGVHDGHVNFSLAPELAGRIYSMPLLFIPLGERVLVRAVDPSLFWGDPQIAPGDELLAIDDVPLAKALQQFEALCSGSTAGMRRICAVRRLSSALRYSPTPQANPILLIRKPNNAEIKVEVPWLVSEPAKDPTFQYPQKTLGEVVYSRTLPQNVGYLRLAAMAPPNEDMDPRDFLAYIESQLLSLRNTKSLIIDVRDNGGGIPLVGEILMKYFITHSTLNMSRSPRLSEAVLALRPYYQQEFQLDAKSDLGFARWKNVIIEPVAEEDRYDKPVVILTNSGCFSACDTFVAAFSTNRLATVIGEPTGGGTGQPLWFNLPSELGRFRFSVVRGKLVNQTFLEGQGTKPDIALLPTAEDLAQGVDSVLIKAHAWLLQKSPSTFESAKALQKSPAEKALFRLETKVVRPALKDEYEFLRLSSDEEIDSLRSE